MTCDEIVQDLKSRANPANVAGMARYGIRPACPLGIGVGELRKIAIPIRKANSGSPERAHALAAELWATGVHEARVLATIIDVPNEVTPDQMDSWAAEFDSWDLCDQACMNLFDRTSYAWSKSIEWTSRDEEFVRRAGYALIASLSGHDKKAEDGQFIGLLPVIERGACDDRNFVKKAVNWALRQIGKRNPRLRGEAIRCAERILLQGSRSARWIARDALRELRAKP